MSSVDNNLNLNWMEIIKISWESLIQFIALNRKLKSSSWFSGWLILLNEISQSEASSVQFSFKRYSMFSSQLQFQSLPKDKQRSKKLNMTRKASEAIENFFNFEAELREVSNWKRMCSLKNDKCLMSWSRIFCVFVSSIALIDFCCSFTLERISEKIGFMLNKICWETHSPWDMEFYYFIEMSCWLIKSIIESNDFKCAEGSSSCDWTFTRRLLRWIEIETAHMRVEEQRSDVIMSLIKMTLEISEWLTMKLFEYPTRFAAFSIFINTDSL